MSAMKMLIRPQEGRAVLVQKFGGTSAGSGARMVQICDIVKEHLVNDNVIVVVSAMSSTIKSEGTTTRLIQAAQHAVKGQVAEYRRLLNLILTSHLVAIHEAMGATEASAQLQESISEDIDSLRRFLDAIEVIGELSPASEDFITGTGEKLSAKILAAVFNHHGVKATYVNLDSVLTRTEKYSDLFGTLRKRMVDIVGPEAEKSVPVVTGFFGDVPGGLLEVVGRGYTDFTAAMIAAEIKARELQLWKEVDGIFSCDPRKVKNARVLARIAPAEAAELSWFGAEVIHPFTMEHVVKAQVPIRIKNTLNPTAPGTLIDPTADYVKEPLPHNRGAVAVSVKTDVSAININPKVNIPAHRFASRVFAIMDKHRLEPCMVSTSTTSISIAVPSNYASIHDVLAELDDFADVSYREGMSIVSLIGLRMKATIGVAGAMFSVLAKNQVNIEMISQGASEINISCLVNGADGSKAVAVIHDKIVYGEVNIVTPTEVSPVPSESDLKSLANGPMPC